MDRIIAIRERERIVELRAPGLSSLELRIPELFGAIDRAELRGEYVVVFTEGGRVSFHAEEPRRASSITWRREHPLLGKMHWHSIRRALRENCLRAELRNRVAFHITHHAYQSGARSAAGSSGRVLIDKQVVFTCGRDFEPWRLGAALAEYLYLAPAEALSSPNSVVAAVALLDRRVSDETFRRLDVPAPVHPLWKAFHDLRTSLTAG